MSRVRLSETTVKLPFLGIDTKWTLSREEQNAAWKLLVQLVTQNAVTQHGLHLVGDAQRISPYARVNRVDTPDQHRLADVHPSQLVA